MKFTFLRRCLCRQWLLAALLLYPFIATSAPLEGVAETNADKTLSPDAPIPAVLNTNAINDLAFSNQIYKATNAVGAWIWNTNTFDKQSCRFWKSFEVPKGAMVSEAILYITVDNGYRLYLDGREIGRGSDWRTITSYDVKWLLNPGKHVLAVDAFNDRLAGGLMFGLKMRFLEGARSQLVSDGSWWVVPEEGKKWTERKTPLPTWHHAVVVGQLNVAPWNRWPIAVLTEPPIPPVLLQFWQRLWFQIVLWSVCIAAISASLWLTFQLALQLREQRLLQRERVRIARDIHDDLGARVTQLMLQGEVAQREPMSDGAVRGRFEEICRSARDLSHSLDEVVWAVNSRRDTLRDFAIYVCKFAQAFLENSAIRCRLDIEPDLPPLPFDLPLRRNLFLAVKEAINNAAKHSGASELYLRIRRSNGGVWVAVEDNGKGFDVASADFNRNGLLNMAHRLKETGGSFSIHSAPGQGFRVEFTLPQIQTRSRWQWLKEFFTTKNGITEPQDNGATLNE